MAFSTVNRNACLFCLRRVVLSIKIPKQYSQNREKAIEDGPDAFDDFTSQLMLKKTEKWEARKVLAKQKIIGEPALKTFSNKSLERDIKMLNIESINVLFQNAIDMGSDNTLIDLTKLCIKYKKCPSLSLLLHALSVCSQTGDRDTIVEITKMCEEMRPEILEGNSSFQHYLAEAVWIRGNIVKSLQMFEEVYRENAFLRRRIRLMMKYLILDVVSNRSEAALLNIIKFSEMVAKEFRDFFPLTCIWQACFLSEWFTDQCIALELLERNEGLFKAVTNRIPYVVGLSLNCHRTEIVYRLLEVLLKHNMEMQYTAVVLSLLDYQIRKGDMRSCSEIIHWCLKNGVCLPSFQHEKLKQIEDKYDKKSDVIGKPKIYTDFKF